MIFHFHTPSAIVAIDPLTASDSSWDSINMPFSEREKYRHTATLAHDFNDKHVQGLLAYNNWASVTPTQKDIILKNLLGFLLFKEGYL